MKETIKIHVGYILLILISIIIILISVQWSQIPKMTDYLTFGLTITSMVLALIAIIYSFVYNSTFSQNVSSLNSVSKSIESNVNTMTSIAENMNKELINIPNLLKSIEGKTDSTLSNLEEIKRQSLIINQESVVKVKEYSNEIIMEFLKNLSMNALKILTFAKCSYIRKNNFLLRLSVKEFELGSWEYAYAFFMPLKGLGIISYKEIKNVDNEYEWLITDFNKYLFDNIDIYIEDFVDKQKDHFTGREFALSIEKIKNHFDLE